MHFCVYENCVSKWLLSMFTLYYGHYTAVGCRDRSSFFSCNTPVDSFREYVGWQLTAFYGIVTWSCHFLGPVVGTKLLLNFSQHAVFEAPGQKIDGQIWDRSKGRNDWLVDIKSIWGFQLWWHYYLIWRNDGKASCPFAVFHVMLSSLSNEGFCYDIQVVMWGRFDGCLFTNVERALHWAWIIFWGCRRLQPLPFM